MTGPSKDLPGLDPLRIERLPFGRQSLFDMINFQIFGVCNALKRMLEQESYFLERREAEPRAIATEDDRRGVSGTIVLAKLAAIELELTAAGDRINSFERKLRNEMTVADLLAEIRALRETIESELRRRHFHYYGQDKVHIALEAETDWGSIISKFPSVKNDALSAADCYALGHSTASVFHLMRVAEFGLRAIARERRVKLPRKQVLEWADWRTIIDEVGKKVALIGNMKRGPARDAALEFYQGAIAHFSGFKDAYRNNVMHTRVWYGATDAITIMRHVHSFMNVLAAKTEENPKRQINWGLRR